MLLNNRPYSRIHSHTASSTDTSIQFRLYGSKRSPRAALYAVWGLGTHPPPILAQNGSTVVLTAFNRLSRSMGQGGGLCE